MNCCVDSKTLTVVPATLFLGDKVAALVTATETRGLRATFTRFSNAVTTSQQRCALRGAASTLQTEGRGGSLTKSCAKICLRPRLGDGLEYQR